MDRMEWRIIFRSLLCFVVAYALMASLSCGGDGDDQDAPTFSIVTFNVLHGLGNEDSEAHPYDRFVERLDLIKGEFAESRPSAILLQEISLLPLPRYPDVIETLLAEMNEADDADYYIVFGNVFGTKPTINGGQIEGQLIMTDAPLIGDPHNMAVSLFRCVIHTRLNTPLGPVYLYNVHLDGGGDYEHAVGEMSDVLGYVENTAGDENTVIMAGDFNSLDDSPVFDLMDDSGFIDLGDLSGLVCSETENHGCTNQTFPLADPENPSSVRIDYVWMKTTKDIEAECTPIFHEPFEISDGEHLWASDHIGVTCSLTLVR